MSLSEQNLREKNFHNNLQSKKKGRFENIFYKALYNLNEDFFKYIEKSSKGKHLLDYGCGVGNNLNNVSNFQAERITCIDISEVSIEKAKKKASEFMHKIEFHVDNCENSKLNDGAFDLIYGSGILHHLNMKKCLNEIHRLLKNNGKMIFIEPLGTNPIINIYRKLTPNSRSEDEHPLLQKDFDLISNKYGKVEIKYYGFLTLVFFLFYRSPKKSFTFKIFSFLDQLLFKIKFLRFLAWSVLIVARKN